MKKFIKKLKPVYFRSFCLLCALSMTGIISGCKTPIHPQKTKYGPPKADYGRIINSESVTQMSTNLFSKIKSFLF